MLPVNVVGGPSIDLVRLRQRLFFDVAVPHGIVDRSLRAYFDTVSYGLARFDADILEPVEAVTTDEALQASSSVHNYEYVFIVFSMNGHEHRRPWAWYHDQPYRFNPPRLGNVLKNGARASMRDDLGVWVMEVTHMLTGFGDLYGRANHPGSFDVMSCACGTHPSSYTKVSLGWLNANDIPIATGGAAETFTIRALAARPPFGSNIAAAVRVPSSISNRYFLAEARLKLDIYEQGMPEVSDGIPSEGIVVYEVDEGVSPPLMLRTQRALSRGDSFVDSAEGLVVRNITGDIGILGTATIAIEPTVSPGCSDLRSQIRDAENEIRELQEVLRHATPTEKPAIVARIRELTAQVRNLSIRARELGCP